MSAENSQNCNNMFNMQISSQFKMSQYCWNITEGTFLQIKQQYMSAENSSQVI